MEYADYGIYERSDSNSELRSKLRLKPNWRSAPLKKIDSKYNPLTKVNSTSGLLKQIYSDIKSVVRYVEDLGELLEQRVIL